MIRTNFALSVGSRSPRTTMRVVKQDPRRAPLTCVWIPTGNPREPLACIWSEAEDEPAPPYRGLFLVPA
jgi:hypothetical protein